MKIQVLSWAPFQRSATSKNVHKTPIFRGFFVFTVLISPVLSIAIQAKPE